MGMKKTAPAPLECLFSGKQTITKELSAQGFPWWCLHWRKQNRAM